MKKEKEASKKILFDVFVTYDREYQTKRTKIRSKNIRAGYNSFLISTSLIDLFMKSSKKTFLRWMKKKFREFLKKKRFFFLVEEEKSVASKIFFSLYHTCSEKEKKLNFRE